MINVAIDGPAGVGKSSSAALLAKRLSALHLDTGAMYRAVAVGVARLGGDTRDAAAVEELLPKIDVDARISKGGQHTFLNGEDVSDIIRTPSATMGSSDVARVPAVRQYLQTKQREIAQSMDVVIDGRDIGTRVLPDSPHKFFLTADARTRALRRLNELSEDARPPFDEMLAAVVARDEQDSRREADPLVAADDAIIIDTSNMTLDEVVDAMERAVLSQAE